jgi:hypothetical protein
MKKDLGTQSATTIAASNEIPNKKPETHASRIPTVSSGRQTTRPTMVKNEDALA